MCDTKYTLLVDSSLDPSPVRPVLVWAEGVTVDPTSESSDVLAGPLQRVATCGEEAVPAEVRQRVRRMLRFGKYKPSGRSKPASEFLLRAALSDEFPRINGPVDVNNAISLESGFPASVFDADLSGSALRLRRGLPGETYVFNPSGQEIDLQDLLLVCDADGAPCGNPVKDAMRTKTHEGTRNVVAVLYAPGDEPASEVRRWGERFAELLRDHCGAERCGVVGPAA